MALSQIQCLDDNHVNPRTHESKPEFLYCEDQRLALEALLRDGREAFFKYLQDRGLRGFLSDPELDALSRDLEPFDPGLELFPANAGDDGPPLSLHYWPNISDTSVPQMDLGWPDCDAYRGVTRVTVHTQPPLDGQAHIKEVVRKMIGQAQKVIAVVMDVFTDVDIFRDLLDAGFRRRVSVYILLERTTLPHFLSMCQRANMHPGHLKHLRVRCTEGEGFFTRSCTRVKGKLGHRFMFIDGDKALSGSYSFTWMSSRLDRNLITVVTGQAVETFDRLFRFLFANSSSVDLRQVATEPEPEQEPLHLPVTPALPSAAMARKLYSPKYALALSGNPRSIASSCQNSLKDSVNTKDVNTKLRKKRREDNVQELPPLHPGLIGLEKACMITYLPTWPEPDPPSDVIGFINIRDASRPTQVHLQRSEMFETSQAIRFSSPFSMPEETLPEVAQPRQLTAKHKVSKPQTAQSERQAEQSVVDKVQSTQLSEDAGDIKSPTPEQKSETDKEATEALDTETKLHSDAPTNKVGDHNTTLHLSATTPCLSSNGTHTNDGNPSTTTQTVPTSSPKPKSPPGSHTTKQTETSVNERRDDEHRTLQFSILTDLISNLEQRTQTKTKLSQTDSNTQNVYIQPQSFSEMIPTDHGHTSTSSVSSTSLSEKKHTPVPAEDSRTINTSTPKPVSCISSSLTPTPPIPKPRTVQLVFKDNSTSNSLTLPRISVVRSPERQASPEPPVVDIKPDLANLVHTPQEKDLKMVPQAQNNSGNKREAEQHSENTENPEEAPQKEQNVTSHGMKHEETVGLQDDRAEVQSASETKPQAQSDLVISDAAKADSVNIQEMILKEVEPKSLTSTDCKITPKTGTDSEAPAEKDTEAPEKTFISCEYTEVPNKKSQNVIQCKTNNERALEPQRISYSEENPADSDMLETVDSLKAPTHSPGSAINNTHHINSEPNMAKQNTHVNVTSQDSQQTAITRESTHTPERPLRLHVYDTHMPDLRSSTHARELRPVNAPAHTPTPHGFHSCSPTLDSQTHTPDPQSVSPDLQMPASDGYITSREDSTPSPTSEEFYECSDTPFYGLAFHDHRTPVHNENMTLTNTPDATSSNKTTTTRPACVRNTTSDETQSSSGHSRVSTSSSSPERVETGEETETEDTNKQDGRKVDEKWKRLSLAEKTTERDSKVVKRRASDVGKKKADDLKQSSQVVKKDKEAQETLMRKRVWRQSSAERQVEGGESINKATETKKLSIGDLKPKRVSPDREETDKEKVVDKVRLRPSGVEGRDRPVSTKDIDRQKTGASSPSQPSRVLSATWPAEAQAQENHQPNQAESKVPQERSQVLVNASPPHKAPSRTPPGVVKSAPARKQDEVSQQLKSKSHPSQKPWALSNSDSQNLAVQQEAEKAPFSFTFGKLYTLKDLKDKMSKRPAMSKKSKTSSPGQGRKNTS